MLEGLKRHTFCVGGLESLRSDCGEWGRESTRVVFHGLDGGNEGWMVYTAEVRVEGDRLYIALVLR